MTVEHHVGDDLLVAYAAGTLDEATSVLVATHLALCPACRHALDLAEALGGAMIEAENVDETVDETAIEAASRGTPGGRGAPAHQSASQPPKGPFVLPRPIRDYAGGDAPSLRWRAVGGGIRQVPLTAREPATQARLLRIPAGKSVPYHGHRGFEATLVLTGSFYDREAWYRRGDVELADPSVVHAPTAGPEEDCIVLAVTDAPLRFQTLIPRLLQPFLGI